MICPFCAPKIRIDLWNFLLIYVLLSKFRKHGKRVWLLKHLISFLVFGFFEWYLWFFLGLLFISKKWNYLNLLSFTLYSQKIFIGSALIKKKINTEYRVLVDGAVELGLLIPKHILSNNIRNFTFSRNLKFGYRRGTK